MTTICSDGITVAADGRADRSDVIVTTTKKKIISRGNRIFACAGSRALFQRVIEWYLAGDFTVPGPTFGDEHWVMMVVDGSGLTYVSSECPFPVAAEVPWAIGSGTQFALGALKAGVSPARAVEIAGELDPWTGGQTQVVNIASALSGGPVPVAAE